MLHPTYRVNLDEGTHDGRFSLMFSNNDLRYQPDEDQNCHVYSYGSRLYVYLNLPVGEQADLEIFNMLGQPVHQSKLNGNGYREMDLKLCTGVYVVTIRSLGGVYTRKVFLYNQS